MSIDAEMDATLRRYRELLDQIAALEAEKEDLRSQLSRGDLGSFFKIGKRRLFVRTESFMKWVEQRELRIPPIVEDELAPRRQVLPKLKKAIGFPPEPASRKGRSWRFPSPPRPCLPTPDPLFVGFLDGSIKSKEFNRILAKRKADAMAKSAKKRRSSSGATTDRFPSGISPDAD